MKKFLSLYFKLPLFSRIIAGFCIGIIFGFVLYTSRDCSWQPGVVNFITPFGSILIAMLKMIVIPIIFFSLIDGAANLPVKKFGKLGGGVLLWYCVTSVFAAIFGCFLAIWMNPSMSGAAEVPPEFLAQLTQLRSGNSGGSSFGTFLVSLFTNPFEALAEGMFLPIIIFALLFGIAGRCVADSDSEKGRIIDGCFAVCKAILLICFKIIDWILEYLPIGVLALTTVNFARYGTDLVGPYMQIICCVAVGIFLMLFAIYPLIVFIFVRENPYKLLWKIRQPVLTAFLTRSSAATLPVSFQTARKELHIKDELSSFALPLGATVNMDGVCVHLPVFAVLAANIFDIKMTPVMLFILIVSIVFASIGAGGIPGGSVFLLFMVLGNMRLNDGQIMLIAALALGINPLLDMLETACNVAGDNICNYIVAKRNGMIDRE